MGRAGPSDSVKGRLDTLDFAEQIIFRHLQPAPAPAAFLSVTEINAEHGAATRAWWFKVDAERRCPVVTMPQFHAAVDALPV